MDSPLARFEAGRFIQRRIESASDYIAAEMVKAFISSGEYRQRLGHEAAMPMKLKCRLGKRKLPLKQVLATSRHSLSLRRE